MKTILRITIYILIITLFLQRIYYRQTIHKANAIRQSILISTSPYNCIFETTSFFFKLPDCKSYKPGTIIKIVGSIDSNFGREDTAFDIDFFEKKRLIIESISNNQSIWSSPKLWFEYIFYIFQTKARLVLTDFLSLFDVKDSYLIGQLSLGFSQVKSESVSHLFKVTGTQYLASISGYHLSLVVRFFTKTARNFLAKRSIGILSLAVSSLYLLFVGIKVPLVRAFLMLFFGVIATCFLFRQSNSVYSLFLAAFILFLIDISVITTMSFQLSFVATASIIYFVTAFKHFKNYKSNSLATLHLSSFSTDDKSIKNNHIAGFMANISKYIIDSIKISIYVQAMIIPLVLYHFNEFSIISLVVSVALTWLVPGIIMLAFSAIFLYLLKLSEHLLRLLILPLSFLSKIFLFVLNLFNNPIFLIKVNYFPWWYILIWWSIVFLIVKIITRKKSVLLLVRCI
ncbi:ComEC/Rec2 family competence protein [Patescibacteria group bacterium]|nr:ComEC/Rec2 family competence protein [Patescibacteria group bacterium]